jgi:Fe-S-cluster containining protein
MQPVNFYSFRQKIRIYQKIFKRFLGRLEKNPPKDLDKIAEQIDKEVWQEVNCLSCANCCKKMTPTFTSKDIKRISAYLGMKPLAFKEKWLHFDKKSKDWVNVKQPCQFLDLATNMCSIYEVRPADCAGFPHLTKKKMVDYIHIHQQNINYCPATYKFVEKMMKQMPSISIIRKL